jgi:hypothetical protein
MVAVLVALSLVVLPMQTRPSLVEKHFPKLTGANAFEDYLQAADVLARSKVSEYRTWFQYKASREGEGWEKIPRIPPGLTEDSTPLDIRREVVQRFGRVVDLIHTGNGKSAIPFRKSIDFDTTFEEYALYKVAAWVMDCAAYVAFADGAASKGVGILLDQLSFAEAISSETLIAYLVGRAIQAVALARFEALLPALSASDAGRIERFCKTTLEQPDAYLACVAGEKQFMLDSIPQVLERTDLLGLMGGNNDLDEKAAKLIAGLTKNDRERLTRLAKDRLETSYGVLFARLRGPEKDWIDKNAPEEDQVPREIATLDDLASYIAAMSMPVFEGASATALRSRCQVRLLGLHARIIQFRWKNERLPDRLSEAVPEEDLIDPMNGDKFQFELREGGYRLYSKGIPETGEIELRYRRPLPSEEPDERPPP